MPFRSTAENTAAWFTKNFHLVPNLTTDFGLSPILLLQGAAAGPAGLKQACPGEAEQQADQAGDKGYIV